jgi:site-specific DNA recombinase
VLAAIYARRSTEQRGADAEAKSVQMQIANARAFAREQGWTVDERHVYFDDAVLGADIRRLKARQQLLDVIARGAPFQILIVREQSRFWRRDGDETFGELKAIARAGVDVWFYRDRSRFSFGTFGDNILGFVKAEAAADYRRQIAGWTYDAMERKARAGHVTGGRVFGYTNVRVAGHVERRIVDDEARIVRRIFELAAAGLGKTTIAKRLNAGGAIAPQPRGQDRPVGWAPSSVREVLHRELYRGVSVWGRTKKRDAGGQVDPHARPESDWLRVEAPQLRVVPEPLWRAAHARLEASRHAYLRGTSGRLCGRPVDGADRKHLLIGLARCKTCGGTIEVNSRRHGRTRQPFYACATHRRRGACICRGLDVLPKRQVDEAVLDTLATKLLSPERLERVCRDVVARFAEPARSAAAQRQRLQKRRTDLEIGISRLIDAIADGVECAPIKSRIRTLEQERADVDRELAHLEASAPSAVTEETCDGPSTGCCWNGGARFSRRRSTSRARAAGRAATARRIDPARGWRAGRSARCRGHRVRFAGARRRRRVGQPTERCARRFVPNGGRAFPTRRYLSGGVRVTGAP